MSYRKAIFFSLPQTSNTTRRFSTCLLNYTKISDLYREGKIDECFKVFYQKPTVFDASFLLFKKEIPLAEHIKIFEKSPKKEPRVLVPMILVYKRNGKKDMTITLTKELLLHLDGMDEESLKRINENTWRVILTIICGYNWEKSLFWYNKTNHFVNYDQENLNQLLTVLLKNSDNIIEIEKVFKKMPEPSVVMLTLFIKKLLSNNDLTTALRLIKETRNIKLDVVIFGVLISFCAKNRLIREGVEIHKMIKNLNLSSIELNTNLMNFYTKCEQPDRALEIFEKLKSETQELNVITWSCAIQAFCKKGKLKEALSTLNEMKLKGISPNEYTFSILLTLCTEQKSLDEGNNLYEMINEMKLSNAELNTSLMNFYTKCGKPDRALEIFEKIKSQKQPINVTTWSCAIQALGEKKQIKEAICLLEEMRLSMIPDTITFCVLLKICAESQLFNEGVHLHNVMEELKLNGIELNTSLMNFYTKCGKPDRALEIFETIKSQKQAINVITWSCAIQALCKKGKLKEALSTLNEMKSKGITPNEYTFSILLTLCTEQKSLDEGNNLYDIINEMKLSNAELNTSLMNFFTKCGQPDRALEIFQKIKSQKQPINVTTWSCAIQALCMNGKLKEALSALNEMKLKGTIPNEYTFSILLALCAEQKSLDEGNHLHDIINEMKISNVELSNATMNFYTKCGQPDRALEIFEKIKTEKQPINVITWNCAIQALCMNGKLKEALSSLNEMKLKGISPNEYTFSILLALCAEQKSLDEGNHLHDIINEMKISNAELNTSLMNFFTKCGQPDRALEIFEKIKSEKPINVTAWNCAFQALGSKAKVKDAILLLEEMKRNTCPDAFTFSILLTLCAEQKSLDEGNRLFDMINEMKISNVELSNAIMNFFTKCGQPDRALEIFEKLKSEKQPMNIITWNCAIQAIAGKKQPLHAVKLLTEMNKYGIQPDEVSFIISLTVCADEVSLQAGNIILSMLDNQSLINPINSSTLCGAIINFHAKTGNKETAEKIFNKSISKHPLDVALWSVMIDAYAKFGDGQNALLLYNTMLEKKIVPKPETIVSVLTACSHSGLSLEAQEIYRNIEGSNSLEYKVVLIDVLSRSNLLKEAEELIGESRDVVSWSTLMGACRTYNNMDVGQRAFKVLLEIDSTQASHYLLMSHIYLQNGLPEKAQEIRNLMKKNNAKKIPGITTIEINGETHDFVSDHKKHPLMKEINEELEKLNKEMLEAGYIPDTRWVTRADIDQSDETLKQKILCRHSEKIALAFAFISLPKGSKIVMKKNLRVCGDCHNATKYISKIRKCEIVVRDSSRYHIFKDGKCSCGDFF